MLVCVCQEYGYIHLSAGDLLRAERKKPGSEVGLLIEKHIQEGSIVPVEITCRLLQQVTLATAAAAVHCHLIGDLSV